MTGQILVNSLVTASLYLLAATGLTLTFGLSRFPNFAYAEFVTAGAFIGFLILQNPDGNILTALLLSFFGVGLISMLSYSVVFRPLVARSTNLIYLMISSIALGYVLRHTIGEIWGWRTQSYQQLWQVYQIGDLRITFLWIIMFVTALCAGIILHLFLTRSRLGKAIRAIANNPDLAAVTGINKQKIILLTWFFGAGLAGTAGVFRAAATRVVPMLGWDILLPMFAVTVLGGIGNFYGLIVAALILGFAENFGVVFLTGIGLSNEYRMAIAFVILIVILVFRPKGLAR
ncbi:MAG: branched-chain amino acid ABC transporter permease [Bacillota bacterium]